MTAQAQPVQKRTKEQVIQEYNNIVFRAGNLQYQIYALSNDLRLLNEAAVKLNLEHAELSKIDAQVAERLAAEKSAEAKTESPKLAAVPTQPTESGAV